MKYANKKTLLLAGLLALIASSAFGTSYWSFVNQVVGEEYSLGRQMQFPLADVTVRNLVNLDSVPLNAGAASFVRVDSSTIAGSDAPELLLNNAAVQIIPVHQPYYVHFRFGTTQGRLFNLAVNGQRKARESICDFDGLHIGRPIVGRVLVTVVPDDGSCQSGSLHLKSQNGSIDRWLFGGQVTRIDDVVMTP